MNANKPPQKPRRRWLRFSLGGLMLLVAVVAVPLGWKVNLVQHQRLIARSIAGADGQVTWAHEAVYPAGDWPGPKWLRNLLGDDFFDYIVQVDLRTAPISDIDIANFAKLPKLTSLSVDANELTDDGFRQIARLPMIQEIFLFSDRMTYDNLRHFGQTSTLRGITLSGQQIDDECLSMIGSFQQLTAVGIQSDLVTDSGLARLVPLPQLILLDLADTSVTDSGVAEFSRAKPQCHVHLQGNP